MDMAYAPELIEQLSSDVHDAWWEEKTRQGFHSPLNCPERLLESIRDKFTKTCDKCHADMYPYSELPENVKDYDRVMVRRVLRSLTKRTGNKAGTSGEFCGTVCRYPIPDIEKRFTYHPPKPGQPEKHTRLRDMCKELAYLIGDLCPESREKSLALTKIEEASMWANAAIARNE